MCLCILGNRHELNASRKFQIAILVHSDGFRIIDLVIPQRIRWFIFPQDHGNFEALAIAIHHGGLFFDIKIPIFAWDIFNFCIEVSLFDIDYYFFSFQFFFVS